MSSCLPLINNPVSLTGHCLCVEMRTEDGIGHTSPTPAFLPPKHHQGHGFSTVEKQTLEIPGFPQVSFKPAYLPIMPKASPQASHHVPCCATNEGSSGNPTMQQQHLSENSRLKSIGIFCQGKHLWSAWCSQDTGTLGLGQRPCPPAKAEVASESKWKFYQHSCEAGAQAPSAHSAKEAVPFLWRPGCWHLELASAN